MVLSIQLCQSIKRQLISVYVFATISQFFEFIIEKLSGPASEPAKPEKKMESSEIVLVAGATGGVGRRVVDILRKKGLPVRILVRYSWPYDKT